MADYVDRVPAKGLALVAGEYGVWGCDGRDTTAAGETLFKVLLERRIGRMVWHYVGGIRTNWSRAIRETVAARWFPKSVAAPQSEVNPET